MIRLACAALVAATLLFHAPAAAQAIDDYTLPFHDPAVRLSYGVDRERRAGPCVEGVDRQLAWTGQIFVTCRAQPGLVYDDHTGLDYPMPNYSGVVAARQGVVIALQEAIGTDVHTDPRGGNYVRLRHPDGDETLYYHLAQYGVAVNVGDGVSAGQWLAQSGNSGLSTGPHLHFELYVATTAGLQLRDPLAERRWTTWPGRVPFLAGYVRESNPNTEVIVQGTTITHWVEFRNLGGRTWRSTNDSYNRGRLILGTWNPPTRTSSFRAADWSSGWLATGIDYAAVAPDGVGRFTFGLKAAPPPGSYAESFNLLANSLHWFDHARLGGFYVPIRVTDGCGPCL